MIFIAPDSELNMEAEAKQAPAYQVKIALEGDQLVRGEHHGRLKLGMTGTAEIVTDQESILSLLFRSIRQGISLG